MVLCSSWSWSSFTRDSALIFDAIIYLQCLTLSFLARFALPKLASTCNYRVLILEGLEAVVALKATVLA